MNMNKYLNWEEKGEPVGVESNDYAMTRALFDEEGRCISDIVSYEIKWAFSNNVDQRIHSVY